MNGRSHPDESHPTVVMETTAAAWLSLRDRGMSASETADFMRWLQEDPRHGAIFAELDNVWKTFDNLNAPLAPPSVKPEPQPQSASPSWLRSRRRAIAWVASAAASIAILFVLLPRHRSYSAETAVGAFQRIDLPEGSVAQLNTDSAIEVEFTSKLRQIRIVRGEVFFNVRSDPTRAFIVTAGPVSVKAVGTAFNVRKRAAAVDVLVTEGKVRVDESHDGRSLLAGSGDQPSHPVLNAGERAVIAVAPENGTPGTASIMAISIDDAQRSLAWQERRLVFDDIALSEVLQEFNRYNTTKLVTDDGSLAAQRFSGTFRADAIDAFIHLLEENFGVRVSRTEREIALRKRQP